MTNQTDKGRLTKYIDNNGMKDVIIYMMEQTYGVVYILVCVWIYESEIVYWLKLGDEMSSGKLS